MCLMLVMPRADVLMGFHKTFHFKCYLSFTLNIKFLETLKKKKKYERELLHLFKVLKAFFS